MRRQKNRRPITKRKRKRLQKKGPRIARNISLLRIIAKSKPKDHKAIIQSLGDDTIKCIGDCSRNILQGRIPLTNIQKKHLSKYKKALKSLSKASSSSKFKKNIIIKQKGGFLGFLLKPIVSAIAGIING